MLIKLAVVLALLILLVAGSVAAIFAAFQRRWRWCAWRTGIVAASVPLAWLGLQSGDAMHFAVMYPYYRAVIAQDGTRPVRFPWGDRAVTVMGGLQYRVLAFDDTGALGRHIGVVEKDESGLFSRVDHLIGNFYIENLYSY